MPAAMHASKPSKRWHGKQHVKHAHMPTRSPGQWVSGTLRPCLLQSGHRVVAGQQLLLQFLPAGKSIPTSPGAWLGVACTPHRCTPHRWWCCTCADGWQASPPVHPAATCKYHHMFVLSVASGVSPLGGLSSRTATWLCAAKTLVMHKRPRCCRCCWRAMHA